MVSLQAEIKRLKAANRAASYERRLLLMQQEEIARLRKNTKKIRDKAATEHTTHGQEGGEKTAEQDFAEQPKVKIGNRDLSKPSVLARERVIICVGGGTMVSINIRELN